MGETNQSQQAETRVRLTAEEYGSLEKTLRARLPLIPTTDLEAGYMLGMQEVLRQLRTGWVIGGY